MVLDVRDLWTDAAASLGYVRNDSLMLKLTQRFEIYCWKRASLIMTNSMIIKQRIEQFVSDPNKIKYFPFNVDLETFKKRSDQKEHHVIYIGNFGAAQDLRTLIKAASILASKIPGLRVSLYGGGDFELQMRQLITELQIEGIVAIRKPVPREEIPSILSKSQIGIVCLAENDSLRYAMPTKTFEYFACGLPVVAYGPSIELRRVMKESDAGIFVENNDHSQVASAIEKILVDKKLYEHCSSNARRFVERSIDCSFLLCEA
jgi:glycosyltransferase involved in cell wall biosynthesis